MNTHETLCSAIRGRHVVEFQYAGHQRRVEPYAVWEDKNEDWQLDGWSVGFSSSGSSPEWRRYNLSKIGNVTVMNDTFTGNRGEFNRDSENYQKAACTI